MAAQQTNHSRFDDLQGFIVGTGLCALGLLLITEGGLITGQTAGLSVLLSYASDLPFGLVFFLVNLPFYAFSLKQMGLRLSLRSFAAVCLISVWSELLPRFVEFAFLSPAFAAVFGGICAGVGLIVIFRHGGSLGGIGLVGLWAQERFHIQAGWVQLAFDTLLFLAALFLIPLSAVVWSLIGAVLLNVIVAVNHRSDRYLAR